MKLTRFAPASLAFILAAGTGAAFAQSYGAPPHQYNGYNQNYGQSNETYNQGYGQGPGYGQAPTPGGWDDAPPEFREMQRRGFRDGLDGARKDFENHRPPNVNNRDEFRDPDFIPRRDRRDYRFGFQRGYDLGVHRIYDRDRDGHDRDHDRDHDHDRESRDRYDWH